MTRILISLAVLISTASSIHGQDAKTTSWKGTLVAGAMKLRLEVDVTSDGKTTQGEFRSVDQGNATFKLDKAVFNDKKFEFKISQLGASYKGTLKDDGNRIEGTFSQSGQKFPLEFEKTGTKNAELKEEKKDVFNLKEAWIGELEMGIAKPVMQFRVGTNGDGKTVAYFDSVTEGRTDFEATVEIKDGNLQFEVKQIRLKYTGKINDKGDEAVGTWSQGGRNVNLTLKKKSEEFDKGKNSWENRPQKPVGPFPYDSEEVKFRNNEANDVTLAGTLTIPKTAGKHPAVILISGSGPQDRDETLMEHKPFLVLADHLSRQGLAVLRYDDRGTAESTGKFSDATSEDFAQDAAAAFDFLKTHDRINPEQIGLAGHSEGGLIAPLVFANRKEIAFVVLLAGTGIPGTEISITQVEAMLRAEGMPEDTIEIEVATTTAVVNTAAKFADDEDFDEKLSAALEEVIETIPEEHRVAGGAKIRTAVNAQKEQLKGKWMQFFLKHDPRVALRKLTCPTLAIIGEKDTQVIPDANMPEIEKALKEAGNKDFEMVILKDLNHLFQTAETGGLSEYAGIQETFNPGALKKISDWIVDHTSVR